MAVSVRLGGGTSIAQGLFIEMFGTTELVFSVIMLAAVKHKATYLAPIGIGVALFVGNLSCTFHPAHFLYEYQLSCLLKVSITRELG
jgi:aquaporin related protein